MAERTPIKAIRAKCIDCCCGNLKEVRLCTTILCPLHEYRMGHRPKKHKVANDFLTEDDGDIISPQR